MLLTWPRQTNIVLREPYYGLLVVLYIVILWGEVWRIVLFLESLLFAETEHSITDNFEYYSSYSQ